MSEENVEVVRRDIAARDARDWTHLPEIWHPDIELALVRGGGTHRGIDELVRLFDGISDTFSEYRVEADEILDAGDQVVTVERLAGRGLKGSAAEPWVHETLFRLISFKEGRIWRVKEYPSREAALEAAGLSE
jgi:ketosteroid isomerase-like protein